MRGQALLVVVGCSACGRIAFDATPDARIFGPWSAPVIAFAHDPSVRYDDPSMSEDGLELYVNVEHISGAPSWVEMVRRNAPTDTWGAPVRINEIVGNVSQPLLTNDTTMYLFDRNARLMQISTRDATRTWSTPQNADDLAQPIYDVAPRPDGLEAIATSSLDVATADLGLIRRTATDQPWGAFELIAELDIPGRNSEGCIAEDGLALYFGSNRTDMTLDLFRATRAHLDVPFSAPEPLVELNSVGTEDSDPWLTRDGRTIFFTTARTGGGAREVWTATR